MKLTKRGQILFLLLLFAHFGSFSQSDAIAPIQLQTIENISTYSFNMLADFNEFSINQRVERIKGLTNDESIVVSNSDNKIYISINPEKTTGDNLHRLLLSIVRLQGYENYTVLQ